MRVVALAVGLTLVLGLAACGGGGSSSTTTADTATTTSTGTETTAAGDPVAGREVFLAKDCGRCHTLEQAGAAGMIGPNLNTDLVGDAAAAGAPVDEYVHTSIVDPDAWVMPRYSSGVMPTDFGSQLSETELADLVAFIVQSAQ